MNGFIFAAGDFYGLRAVPEPGDVVAAADAGYRTCREAGITPDVVLGDFDSMDVPEAGAEVVRLPVEKDDTDTMAAVKLGLERGCSEFLLYGASGGKRLDHTLANIQSLLYLCRHGARGFLYDDDFLWTAMENGTLTVPRTVEWGLLSVFCLGDRSEGVTETGVQYPLDGATVTNGFPIGVSNHILADRAEISVQNGALLVGWELPRIKK